MSYFHSSIESSGLGAISTLPPQWRIHGERDVVHNLLGQSKTDRRLSLITLKVALQCDPPQAITTLIGPNDGIVSVEEEGMRGHIKMRPPRHHVSDMECE